MNTQQIKKGYNWAFGSAILQIVLSFGLSFVISAAMSVVAVLTSSGSNAEEVSGDVMGAVMKNAMVITAICYIIADLVPVLIGMAATKGQGKIRNWFSRSKLGAFDVTAAVFATLGIAMIDSLLITLYTNYFGSSGVTESISDSLFSGSTPIVIVTILYVCLIGPFLEELLFRGFILQKTASVSPALGIVLSSVMFGMFHGDMEQVINATIMGLFFGYIALKANSIWPTIIMHIVNNSFSCALTVLEEKMDIGETGDYIIMGVFTVIGVAALVYILAKYKKINKTEDIIDRDNYVCPEAIEEIKRIENKKNLSTKLIFECPLFYIAFFMLICLCVGTMLLAKLGLMMQ